MKLADALKREQERTVLLEQAREKMREAGAAWLAIAGQSRLDLSRLELFGRLVELTNEDLAAQHSALDAIGDERREHANELAGRNHRRERSEDLHREALRERAVRMEARTAAESIEAWSAGLHRRGRA